MNIYALIAAIMLCAAPCRGGAFLLAHPAAGHETAPAAYWTRTELPKWNPCKPYNLPYYIAEVKVKDMRTAEPKVRDFLAGYGTAFSLSDCSGRNPVPRYTGAQIERRDIRIWLPPDAINKVQKEITKWGNWEMRSAGRPDQNPYEVALEKWEMLTRELKKNGALLKSTPLARSFVENEIARLAEAAVPYKAVKDKVLLQLNLSEPKDPPDLPLDKQPQARDQ